VARASRSGAVNLKYSRGAWQMHGPHRYLMATARDPRCRTPSSRGGAQAELGQAQLLVGRLARRRPRGRGRVEEGGRSPPPRPAAAPATGGSDVAAASDPLLLLCSMCSQQRPVSAFTARQAKRKDGCRKCSDCVGSYPPSSAVSRYEGQQQQENKPLGPGLAFGGWDTEHLYSGHAGWGAQLRADAAAQVRKTPSWPRS
jgi:hypothetical protein